MTLQRVVGYYTFNVAIIWLLYTTVCLAWVAMGSPTAQAESIACTSPNITLPAGGGTGTANIDCTLTNGLLFSLVGLSSNYISPSSTTVQNSGGATLAGTRNPLVTSPDNSYNAIIGTAAGYTAIALFTPATLRFQYTFTSNASTPAGSYTTTAPVVNYYRTSLFQSGSASANITVNVPLQSSMSCTSPAVTAPGGGGSFTLRVSCMLNGNGPTQLVPAGQNTLSPTTMVLTHGSHSVQATLQPTVTSPNGTIVGITGTATGGFSGTILSTPALFEATYTGTTTTQTTGGTYTSSPVSVNWAAQ